MASTGAYPTWICRALRYGNDSLDRSASVSRPISVRDAGPCTDSSVVPEVTSVTVRNSPGRVARLISGSIRRWMRSLAMTRNFSGSSQVTVTSATMPPASFSHWV